MKHLGIALIALLCMVANELAQGGDLMVMLLRLGILATLWGAIEVVVAVYRDQL